MLQLDESFNQVSARREGAKDTRESAVLTSDNWYWWNQDSKANYACTDRRGSMRIFFWVMAHFM